MLLEIILLDFFSYFFIIKSGLIPAMKNICIKIPTNTENPKCNIFVLYYFVSKKIKADMAHIMFPLPCTDRPRSFEEKHSLLWAARSSSRSPPCSQWGGGRWTPGCEWWCCCCPAWPCSPVCPPPPLPGVSHSRQAAPLPPPGHWAGSWGGGRCRALLSSLALGRISRAGDSDRPPLDTVRAFRETTGRPGGGQAGKHFDKINKNISL